MDDILTLARRTILIYDKQARGPCVGERGKQYKNRVDRNSRPHCPHLFSTAHRLLPVAVVGRTVPPHRGIPSSPAGPALGQRPIETPCQACPANQQLVCAQQSTFPLLLRPTAANAITVCREEPENTTSGLPFLNHGRDGMSSNLTDMPLKLKSIRNGNEYNSWVTYHRCYEIGLRSL